MRHERQLEILERIERSGPRRTGLYNPHSAVAPATAYTDADRFAAEIDILYREGVVVFALSCELPTEGSYQAQTFGDIPILVVRQPDGSLRAMVNACRHRAAPLVSGGETGHKSTIQCPYHAWTYDLDGKLRARPGASDAFDDVPIDCDLHPVVVAEKYGMIFVRPRGDKPIDVDAVLAGAEDDLGSFGLEDYVHIESRMIERPINWKLLLDTFCESYHIRTLHKDTLAPYFDSNCIVHQSFGPNQLSCGFRNTIDREFAKPAEQRSLLPYGTIQYFIVPNLLIVHQVDHVEMWRLEPLAVDQTRATVSLYAPHQPADDEEFNYYLKNLDLLLDVTDNEDFALMAQVQRNLRSGAIPEVVYGRIEPPLIHLHEAIDEMLSVGGWPASE